MAKAEKFGLKELDALPETDLKGLRVRNVCQNIIVIGEGGGAMVLTPFEETIIGAAVWRVNRSFREHVNSGNLLISPADVYDSPRPLPNLDTAPDGAVPETTWDRNYANHILVAPIPEALEMVNDEAVMEGGELNVRFMKGRMLKILRAVEWAEPQLQNRKAVKDAVRDHIGSIRAL